MKMTSNLNDISDSNCIVFSPATETSGLMDLKSHNDSYICTMEENEVCDKLNKSELDIEIEMCEELLSTDCTESDQAAILNFDKENVSDLSEWSDTESVSTVNTDNYFIKINDEELCSEGQLPAIAPDLSLSDLINMHTTIDDNVISKSKEQLELPQEKDVKGIFENTRNTENHPCTESNDPLKFTFNEFENKEANVLSGLSDDTVLLKYQDGGECQNMKCNELNEIPTDENKTLLAKDSPETLSKLNENLNDEVLNSGEQPSVNGPESTISVSEKSHELNFNIESNDEKQFPLENYEANTLVCENDNDELAETDVSTIEEFEMSILDVTENDDHLTTNENDDHFTTNENDEILFPSNAVENGGKIVSSIIVKCPPQSLTEQIKADEKEMLDSKGDSITIKVEKDQKIVHIKEDEKDDLLDPRWDKIKQLSTDEERYQQVKNCWKCSTVPDPNKNLTYHSFRKRHFKNTTVTQTKPRKRMASNNLNEQSAKRSRSCTYHLDHKIQTVSAKEKKETERIMLEMNNEISRVNRTFEQEMQKQLNPNRGCNTYAFGQLQTNLQNKIASIRSQYKREANHCTTKVETEIHALNVARNEVLQFYKFYKGLNSRNDPTVLTFEQNLELEEIENVYSKFNQLYK